MKLSFEKSIAGRVGTEVPAAGVKEKKINELVDEKFLRKELPLPELSEMDVVRHFIALSRRNFGVDNGFYPLGSCTMKYNPKINEITSSLPGFANSHPLQPEELSQGSLQLMYDLQEFLKEITGFSAYSLQPAAGAHGELTGIMIAKKYFEDLGEERKNVLLPDSSHGTNPASVNMCNFNSVEIKSNERGGLGIDDLKQHVDKDTAVLMLTNPNTLGLFDENIMEICEIVHEAGGLVYCDGANANAILGKSKIAEMGFDITHLNLHKSFSTPHGGGGPGSGPVGVVEKLKDFLPKPVVGKKGENYFLDYDIPKSIGRMKAFYGNFGVMVRAYTYIRALGAKGIREVGENAVLNANYLKERLKKTYHLQYDRICQHEFVLSDKNLPNEVTTIDVAKRLLDLGFHAPTIYFPLIVKGAIMIEPTETEGKETLDEFAEAMEQIAKEAKEKPECVKGAPLCTPVGRLDAVKAAREPNLNWFGRK
ncbi:MAG: aminomethyl-transferring glycine dehydrogenase subunit GcvPB [Candidatus Diapherotrites archaeon]